MSFTLLQNWRFSEIKETQNEISFDEYWNDSDSFDMVKDWKKSKHLLYLRQNVLNVEMIPKLILDQMVDDLYIVKTVTENIEKHDKIIVIWYCMSN